MQVPEKPAQLSWYPLLIGEMEDIYGLFDPDPDVYALKLERVSVLKTVLEYLLKIQSRNLDEFKNIRTHLDKYALECLVGETREVLLDRFDKDIENTNKKIEIYQQCLKQEEYLEEITKLAYQSGQKDVADLDSIPDLSEDEREKIFQQNFRRLQENIRKIAERYGIDKKGVNQ